MKKKNVYFFQPQYATIFKDQKQYWLPYSAGCVWAYCQQFPDVQENWHLAGLHYKREPIEDVLKKIHNPALATFSCYMWNEQYELTLAKKIKERWPECIVIFGGPQTGSNHKDIEFIDHIIMAEGEESFLDILRVLASGGKPQRIYMKKRLDHLDIPSPYTIGLFDDIIKNRDPGDKFQLVIETNRGCPYSCTYCDWGGLTYSKIRKFPLEKIEEELVWIRNNPISVVFLADANFGIFKERDLGLAKMFNKYLSEGCDVEYLNMNYPKNSNEHVFEVAAALGKLVRAVTLSQQSLNPATLKAIKRDNMTINDLTSMLKLSQKYNIPTYSDMILGLPEETYASWRQGLLTQMEMGQNNHLDIYIATVLENTELNQVQKKLYNIDTIKVKNYQSWSYHDESGITEYTELVRSTNTMSLEELVDSYMYYWLTQNFHYQGYSQFYSKYCRHVANIDYGTYYDTLLDLIKKDQGIVGQEYWNTKNMLKELLTLGEFIDKKIEVHFFFTQSYLPIYQDLQCALDLAKATAEKFVQIDNDLEELQKMFVYNSKWPAKDITVNYDIETGERRYAKYSIKPQLTVEPKSHGDMHFTRRSGKIKNAVTVIK